MKEDTKESLTQNRKMEHTKTINKIKVFNINLSIIVMV